MKPHIKKERFLGITFFIKPADRLVYKEVIDFLHFRLWSGYSWPDFNLADSWIVVGVALLVLELLATEGEQRVEAREAPSGD